MSDPPQPIDEPEELEIRAVERTGGHAPLDPQRSPAAVPVLDFEDSAPQTPMQIDETPVANEKENPAEATPPEPAPDVAVEETEQTAALEETAAALDGTEAPESEPPELRPPPLDDEELELQTKAEARPDLVAAAEAAALLSPEEAAKLEAVLPTEGDATAAFDPPRHLFDSIPDPEDAPEPQSLVLGNVPEEERPKFQQAATEFVPVVRPVPAVVKPATPRVVEIREPTPPARPARKQPPTPPPEPSEPSVILDLKFRDGEREEEAKTNVFNPVQRENPLPRGRLVVQGGEFDGKSWYLNRARTHIGRGTDNDIVLLDISVSRQHVRLDRHGEGFRVVDLDSGNGSYVNSRRITRCEIYDGDLIEVGDLVMQFSTVGQARERLDSQPSKITDPSIVVEPATPPARGFPIGWMVVWIAVTFLAVFGALFVTRRLTQPAPEAAAEDLGAQARAWFQRAEQAAARRDWAVAGQNIQVARKLAPELLPYDALATTVAQAGKDAQAIQAARAQIDALDPKTALTTLAAVPPSGAYAKEVALLTTEARTAQIAGLKKQAEGALERAEYDKATAAAQALLAVSPNDERAKGILAAVAEQSGKAPDGKAPDKVPDGKTVADAGVAAPPDAGAQTDEQALLERAKREMASGLRHYRRGRFADAIVAYERAAGRKVERKLRRMARRNAKTVQDFDRAWTRGRQAADARKFSSATKPLEEARALDRRMGGYYRSAITKRLVDSYYFMAARALASRRYGQAASHSRRVLKLDPGHQLARKMGTKLEADAAKVVSQAQASSGSKREKLARMAMDMSPAGSPTYEAAKALLPK